MSNKFHDLNGLVYYSTKLCNYLKVKFQKIEDKITIISSNTISSLDDITKKVQTNTANIASNTQNISDNVNVITTVDNKVDKLEIKINNLDVNKMDGNIVNINKVEQYIFNDIAPGDVVEIPNTTGAADFMIECYTDIGVIPEVEHQVIELNSTTIDKFIYDPRFIEVSSTGIKPKDTITLNYMKTQEVVAGVTYTYYISDIMPEELLSNLNSITSIEES